MKNEVSRDTLDLIEGCLAGEETAWEGLVSKYERLIYSTCRHNNLSQSEADDVFGQTCLLLLENLGRLKNRASLSSWLITTTNRQCWRYKKNLKLVMPLLDPQDNHSKLWEQADDTDLPQDKVLELERQQDVREALQQLAPRCQKLLWYLFYAPQEPSYAEIAAALKLPVASIGPNRARCLARLRLQLNAIPGEVKEDKKPGT